MQIHVTTLIKIYLRDNVLKVAGSGMAKVFNFVCVQLRFEYLNRDSSTFWDLRTLRCVQSLAPPLTS